MTRIFPSLFTTKALGAAAALLLLMPGAAARPAVAQTATAITASDLVQRVQVLAHDSMLGRDAGRIGNVRATSYVARELARHGLVEAGESGYFQTIPLVTRGPARDARLSINGVAVAGADMRPLRAMAGTPFGGTFTGESVEVVYGGALGSGALIDPTAARGKVVVFRAARDPRDGVSGRFAGAPGELAPYVEAAAILLEGLDRMTPQAVNGLSLARFTLADETAADRRVPAAIIRDGMLTSVLGETADGSTRPAPRVSGQFGLIDTPTPEPARNVIGIVRGTDPMLRNEFVAIGAHTDHVGVGTAVDHDSVRIANEVLRPFGANQGTRGSTPEEAELIRELRNGAAGRRPVRLDSIYNGADDNASGVAVALELAEYFAKNPPKRSLLFVFHTAEEKGLFGAEYFTDNPTVPRDAIVAQINLDQVSRGGPADVAGSEANTVYLLGTRRLSTQLGDLVESVNARHNLRLDYALDQPGHPASGYCRSDHYMYARYSIPIVFLSAGWHRDYHMVTDEAQYSNPRTMLQIGGFVSDIVEAVANLRERPLVDQPRMDPSMPCRQ